MLTVDLNCDMGEGMKNDSAIMPFISSANIACGFHAGNEQTMKQTVELALRYGVAIGAHPSFNDKENFGRSEMNLSNSEIYQLVTRQINILAAIAKSSGASLHHVKPHGALYNMSARQEAVAAAIAKAVYDYNPALILFGLSESVSIREARKAGLKTASEVFADRTYQDDGTLTSRKLPGALIESKEQMARQVLQMIKEKTVTTVSGKKIPICAETVCIHGDGEHAAEFAAELYTELKKNNIEIQKIR